MHMMKNSLLMIFRFTKILQGWIKEDEVPRFDSFTKEKKKKKDNRKRKVSVRTHSLAVLGDCCQQGQLSLLYDYTLISSYFGLSKWLG